MARTSFSKSAPLVKKVFRPEDESENSFVFQSNTILGAMEGVKTVYDISGRFIQLCEHVAGFLLSAKQLQKNAIVLHVLSVDALEDAEPDINDLAVKVAEKMGIPVTLLAQWPQEAIIAASANLVKAPKENPVYRIYFVTKGNLVVESAISQKSPEDMMEIVFRDMASS